MNEVWAVIDSEICLNVELLLHVEGSSCFLLSWHYTRKAANYIPYES
jgi:hypothetical protein